MKHNFNHIFDRPVLCGKIGNVLIYANGTIKRNKSGKSLTEIKACENRCIDLSFAKKHKSLTESLLSDFMSVFLRLQDNSYSTPKKRTAKFSDVGKMNKSIGNISWCRFEWKLLS